LVLARPASSGEPWAVAAPRHYVFERRDRTKNLALLRRCRSVAAAPTELVRACFDDFAGVASDGDPA
jgi:hypothetical protein